MNLFFCGEIIMKKLQIFRKLKPVIKYGRTASVDEIYEIVSGRTGLNKSELVFAFEEGANAALLLCCMGRKCRLPGIGKFIPHIDSNGKFYITISPDRSWKQKLNSGQFIGDFIKNKENIGLTSEQLIEKWNQEHPDDPAED